MTVAVYATPLRSRFRGLASRDGLLLGGPAGWAEFSPFWDYDDATAVPWLRAAVEAATLGFPAPVRHSIPVNVTVPAVDPERARALVRASGGCTTAKVKVAEPGQSRAEEVARLEAVRDALGPGGHVRIDANGGWGAAEAIAALPVLDRAAGGLQYAEQPCPTVPELAEVRRRVGVPIAADESIRRATDPFAVKRADAADIVVLKVQPLGGVRACLELAAALDMPVVVSSALESSVGIAMGVALAAALPDLPLASGLATVQLFERDVTSAPLLPVGGELPVRRVVPDALAPVDAATAARWLARLDAVAHLAGIDLAGIDLAGIDLAGIDPARTGRAGAGTP